MLLTSLISSLHVPHVLSDCKPTIFNRLQCTLYIIVFTLVLLPRLLFLRRQTSWNIQTPEIACLPLPQAPTVSESYETNALRKSHHTKKDRKRPNTVSSITPISKTSLVLTNNTAISLPILFIPETLSPSSRPKNLSTMRTQNTKVLVRFPFVWIRLLSQTTRSLAVQARWISVGG